MRRLATIALVLVCCVSITPGVREVVLDAAHMLLDGHAAHGCDDLSEDAEHGCTGPFHACACHGSTPMAGPTGVMSRALLLFAVDHVRYSRAEARDGPLGHDRQLLRPPTT